MDIDPRHGGDRTIAELEAKHGPLPPTVTAETGGGGYHLYYAMPEGEVRNSTGLVGPGIDIRAEGGYITARPSIHPATGKPYRYVPGLALRRQTG